MAPVLVWTGSLVVCIVSLFCSFDNVIVEAPGGNEDGFVNVPTAVDANEGVHNISPYGPRTTPCARSCLGLFRLKRLDNLSAATTNTLATADKHVNIRMAVIIIALCARWGITPKPHRAHRKGER